VSEEDNRWDEFSDEEVQILHTALLDAEQVYAELTEAAKAMIEEVMTEYERRENARRAATYRGPGYYTDVASGITMHVVGQATIDHVRCLLVGSSLEDPHLWALPAHKIEGRDEYGNRRYEYSAVQP
jgi:hypothetical protein